MIWERAFGAKADFQIEKSKAIPRLTEAWYCCAEPEEDPFALM